MNFQFYHEKLINSEEYQTFVKEHPEAFPCTGFFILDKTPKDPQNKANIDFYLPKEKKMYSFKLNNKTEFVPVENFDKRIPEKISLNYDFNFEDFEKLIQTEMDKQKIKNKIQKLLFSFQNLDKKDYLVATIFLSGMALLKVNIDINKKEITDFKKESFMDMFKLIKGNRKS